jgi:hypothetical protein
MSLNMFYDLYMLHTVQVSITPKLSIFLSLFYLLPFIYC